MELRHHHSHYRYSCNDTQLERAELVGGERGSSVVWLSWERCDCVVWPVRNWRLRIRVIRKGLSISSISQPWLWFQDPAMVTSGVMWVVISTVRVCLLVALLFDAKVRAVNVTAEIDALLNFKILTSAWQQSGSGLALGVREPRGLWDSWNEEDSTPCNWVGISCSAENSVRSIDLSGWGVNQLSGMGIEELAPLENLEQLTLSDNNIGDVIPDEIGTLVSLRVLDLSNSQFNGELPKTLNQLKRLRSLYLDGNSLTGGIPTFDNLTELQVLTLARNKLSGVIPRHLNNLSTLNVLDLSSNEFSGLVPVLTNLSRLLELNLNDNNLTGFKDPRFPGPENLKQLFMSRNQLRGSLPVGLLHMLKLEVLNLSSNQYSGVIPYGLARQTNQSFWLDLSDNQLQGNLPKDLFLPTSFRQAFYLNLSHNLLTGSIPEKEGDDQRFISALDLSHNQLTGVLPRYLSGETAIISKYRLEYNQLEGDIVEFIANLSLYALAQELSFSNNRFTGNLSNLQLGGLMILKVVDLSNNRLTMSKTGDDPDPLRTLWESFIPITTSLREFRIAGNVLEGVSLPLSVLHKGVEALEIFDVSDCGLVGPIVGDVFDPSSVFFESLKVLNLSNNHLTGPLPLNITLLPNLTTLDVSGNNLSGRLPDIPLTSNLYDARLFQDNPGLCGAPLPACPSPSPPLRTITVYKNGLSKSLLIAIILLSVLVPVASCILVYWKILVYKKLHKQDADLIATLLERETTALIPLREIKRATDNFTDSAQIGEGGFGKVYMGSLQDGTVVAIKRSKRDGSEAGKQQFLNEVRILSQVNHRHLVKLLGCCMENKVAVLVFEFVPNGTLQEHLQGKRGTRLSWKQRLHIAVQTADALNYLHSSANYPIIHRDVKSANILLTEKLTVKVADFGISKLSLEEVTHMSTAAVQGTVGYIDPDYYATFQLTSKSDVFSFGVVLLELISAQSVIDFQRPDGDASINAYTRALLARGELESLIDPVLMDSCNSETMDSLVAVAKLALKCAEARSRDRPTMKEVLKELQTYLLQFEGPTFLPPSLSDQIEYITAADVGGLFSSSGDRGDSPAFLQSITSTSSDSLVELTVPTSEKLTRSDSNEYYKKN
ncbi:hypothetical protein R1sor_012751 [Riccia sorocarpa]|uniref:non-specific serine/threonine protein kinase n=1 Tax=Riccia sorocarpa TaxID=122646 RepID=A0ABD3I8F6_9MARC